MNPLVVWLGAVHTSSVDPITAKVPNLDRRSGISVPPARGFAAVSTILVTYLWLSTAGPAMAALGDCGQPLTGGDTPLSSDCLFVLRAAVKLDVCDECVCNIDGVGSISASDALSCLLSAVNSESPQGCPACITTTTTSPGSTFRSSTSTSTTSTTTTLPLFCLSDIDCIDRPGQRCNPNNGLCEAPCSDDDDCKDFFECDLGTQLCTEPSD